MWFKHRAWIPVAWVLSLGNLLAAVWVAARPDEPLHATIHALLAVGFAVGARRLTARHRTESQDEDVQQTIDDMQARLLELEERLDFAERILAKHRDVDHLEAPRR